MERLLYFCLNDGSDTRINKEIGTLARRYEVDYLGIGRGDKAFVAGLCHHFRRVEGHHREIWALVRYLFTAYSLVLRGGYGRYMVVNENLLLMLWPVLWLRRGRVVCDVFDSIFLRIGQPGGLRGKALAWAERAAYSLPFRVIVTDDARKELLPAWVRPKTVVVPNYPLAWRGPVPPKACQPGSVRIFYNGSMTVSRGTEILRRLLEVASSLEVVMAGWAYDAPTQALTTHPQVSWLGVITQQQAMAHAAEADYILSLYEPVNQNNINASPNKIYDALQAGTPVIINAEVKVSAWVARHGVGMVLPTFYVEDYDAVWQALLGNMGNFTFDPTLRDAHTWEAVEAGLI